MTPRTRRNLTYFSAAMAGIAILVGLFGADRVTRWVEYGGKTAVEHFTEEPTEEGTNE